MLSKFEAAGLGLRSQELCMTYEGAGPGAEGEGWLGSLLIIPMLRGGPINPVQGSRGPNYLMIQTAVIVWMKGGMVDMPV